MDTSQVSELMNFIHNTFSKPLPNEKKLGFYYDELNYMDSGSLDAVKQHFRNLDTCPSNLVKEVKAAYDVWVKDKPSIYKKTGCRHCENYGSVRYLAKWPDGKVDECVGRCPHCENWRGELGVNTPKAPFSSIPVYMHFTEADRREFAHA